MIDQVQRVSPDNRTSVLSVTTCNISLKCRGIFTSCNIVCMPQRKHRTQGRDISSLLTERGHLSCVLRSRLHVDNLIIQRDHKKLSHMLSVVCVEQLKKPKLATRTAYSKACALNRMIALGTGIPPSIIVLPLQKYMGDDVRAQGHRLAPRT